MNIRPMLSALMLCATFLGACGDDTNNGTGPGGGSTASVASCNAQCDAQEKVVGCKPFVDLATCKQLCGQLVRSTAAACGDKFNAYYNCSAADGFVCAGSLVTNTTKACDDELDTLNTCSNGGSNGPACEGARDSGTCPQVPCPCAGGTKMVSGFDNTSGSCKCLDELTCKDLFCD